MLAQPKNICWKSQELCSCHIIFSSGNGSHHSLTTSCCPENSSKADLAPTRSLLEAITQLLRSFSHSQVLLHIAALPLGHCQLHAQSIIFRQGVRRRPAHLLKGLRPRQEVSTCGKRDESLLCQTSKSSHLKPANIILST